MTLPLTRPSQGDTAQDTGPCATARWRAWLAAPARLSRRRAAALRAAAEHDWPAALLAACALFACVVAAISANAPQRLWGIMAAGAYGLAAVAALAGRRRGVPFALVISLTGALILPLAWMAFTHSGQPEVGVVLRSAGLFLHRGTPYQGAGTLAATHDPDAYNPYLPALAVFGLPHAVLGASPLTDPRLWFGVTFVAAFGGALTLSGVRRPWLWTAVVTASPVVAYPLSTGGDDLPVLALLCLGLALLRPAPSGPGADGPLLAGVPGPGGSRVAGAALGTRHVTLAGVMLGLAAGMKATAWPAVAVALALAAARGGWRAAGWLALAALAVPLAVDGPVLFAQPSSVATNTILFPLGLTKIKTQAASALPGHLIAQACPWGHWAAIGIILAAGLVIAAWLVVRPPQDERAAGWRLVAGLSVMFGFAPATRFGYIVYPLGLACWLALNTWAHQGRLPAGQRAPHRQPVTP